MFALIENNVVTKTFDGLPTAWQNISGLNLLTKAELAGLNIYPAEVAAYDDVEFECTGYTAEIKDGIAVLSPILKHRDLDFEKELKHNEINLARNEAEDDGFDYLGKRFDSDDNSMKRITTAALAAMAAMAAKQPFNVSWVCADNSLIALDGPAMIGMPVEMAQVGYGIHLKGRKLKDAIDAATTVAAVRAISW